MATNSYRNHLRDFLALFVFLIGLAILGLMSGPTEEGFQQARYCYMVALYKNDPSKGWPDYEGTFAQHCRPDGSLKD